MAEGRREVLLDQIEAKFGSVEARYHDQLNSASDEQLTRSTQRILTATSIDELFKD